MITGVMYTLFVWGFINLIAVIFDASIQTGIGPPTDIEKGFMIACGLNAFICFIIAFTILAVLSSISV